VSLERELESFKGKTVCVIGDLMLDEYVWGRAARISPEAPVMVLEAQRNGRVPGGAANVAHNVQALGGRALLVGVAGADEPGEALLGSLRDIGVDTSYVVTATDRLTTRKTRIIAQHQQVIRVDWEERNDLTTLTAEALVERATAAIERSDAVVLSDYRKGCLNQQRVQAFVAASRDTAIPCVANPKPAALPWMSGTSLVSVNRVEASEFVGANDLELSELISLTESRLAEHGIGQGLITLGEEGMHLCGTVRAHVPALRVEVYDTAGAGDTVIATIGLGLAAGLDVLTAARIASVAAGCVVRHVGVVVPTPDEVVSLARSADLSV
jgi:D-beta-D-heptose 7-phosphate kinase/D-beta-D-heptose 1-phosphate adenosyltransferase